MYCTSRLEKNSTCKINHVFSAIYYTIVFNGILWHIYVFNHALDVIPKNKTVNLKHFYHIISWSYTGYSNKSLQYGIIVHKYHLFSYTVSLLWIGRKKVIM